MSSLPRYVPHYTLDDYRQWEGHWELIDGVAIAMTPSPFGPHERVISRLSRCIGNQLEQCNSRCEVYTNLDWIVTQDTVIRPELMVVCGEQPMQHLERPPAIVAEVLSEATRVRDLTAKRAIYVEKHVSHILLIDPDTRTITLVTGEASRVFSEAESIEVDLSGVLPRAIVIECGQLFDRL